MNNFAGRLRRRLRAGFWCTAGAAVAAAALSACATGGSMLEAGHQAERLEDWDRAVVEYTAAVREDPKDQNARLALERAKLRAMQVHVSNGRRFASLGKIDEALVEYQIASQLSPASTEIEDALRNLKAALRARVAVTTDGKTQLQSLIERTRDLPPAGLDLPADAKIPDSLVFREAGIRDVYTALARFAGVSVVFDPAFRDATLTVDLRKATLEQALASVSASTRNFYRVTAPRTLTIVPDTPAKRREYRGGGGSHLLPVERRPEGNRRPAPHRDRRAKDFVRRRHERHRAQGHARTRLGGRQAHRRHRQGPPRGRDRRGGHGSRPGPAQGVRVQIASPLSPGIDGAVAINQAGLTVRDLQTLTSADVFLTSFPALFYRLLKSDSSSRVLANPQLRALEGTAAQARFGERVPVPNTTFQPIATGGVAQQPVTSYTYENIGVNIDITPRTHHNDDVSLALKVEVSAISGKGYGDLPTFGNRSVTTIIRLRDGETSVLAGLIRDEERTSLDGIPGLSDIPFIGRFFAHNKTERIESDIIITLTPHIVRVLDLSEVDLRPFRVGRDTGGPILDLLEPVRDQQPVTLPKPIIK